MIALGTAMKAIAIIPARGGSKGVPRKNLAIVGGRTLLERAVRTCKSSPLVEDVLVTSDDDEILDQAVGLEAVPIRRPAELATDAALGSAAIDHALAAWGQSCDLLVIAQTTTPFVQPKHLRTMFALMSTGHWPIVSLCHGVHLPIWRLGQNVEILTHEAGARRTPRQQDGELAADAGWWIYERPWWDANGDSFQPALTAFVRVAHIPYGWQIDEPEELAAAEDFARRYGL